MYSMYGVRNLLNVIHLYVNMQCTSSSHIHITVLRQIISKKSNSTATIFCLLAPVSPAERNFLSYNLNVIHKIRLKTSALVFNANIWWNSIKRTKYTFISPSWRIIIIDTAAYYMPIHHRIQYEWHETIHCGIKRKVAAAAAATAEHVHTHFCEHHKDTFSLIYWINMLYKPHKLISCKYSQPIHT